MSSDEQLPFFVYGTLRRGQSAYPLLEGRTEREEAAVLPGFKLYSLGEYPAIYPAENEHFQVIGEIMTIAPTHYVDVLAALDRWEGYTPEFLEVSLYWRENREAFTLDGQAVQVTCYVGNPAFFKPEYLLLPEGDWAAFRQQPRFIP
jgi:gamma-glutamylcyclotransferase (GGCT)/AIG2-like uncharacterized protein YtfP